MCKNLVSMLVMLALFSVADAKDMSLRLREVRNESRVDVAKLKNSTERLKQFNQQLENQLNQLKNLELSVWSEAFLKIISVIPPDEAERRFSNPKSEVEKILAAQLIRLQSKISSKTASENTKKALAYMEKEADPAYYLFLNSLDASQRSFVVQDNPLAFGTEIEFIATKTLADKDCTIEDFKGAFQDFDPIDIKKNAFLFSAPYYIYQNRYLPSYNLRLLQLAQKWKNEKSRLVQNILTAHLISSSLAGLRKMNEDLLIQHETQVRQILGKDATSQEIEAFERKLAARSPKCFGAAMSASTKVMKIIFQLNTKESF